MEKHTQTTVAIIFMLLVALSFAIISDTADARKKSGSSHSKYSKDKGADLYYEYLLRRNLAGVLQKDQSGTPIAPRSFSQGTEVLAVPYGERNNPLTIKTASKSNYYVKLQKVGTTSNTPVMTMFIRGGETLSTKVPPGNYVVKYATGDDWHGEEYLFWDTTRFYKTDEVFEFIVETEYVGSGVHYVYRGYTVELIEQISGNLETTEIPATEF